MCFLFKILSFYYFFCKSLIGEKTFWDVIHILCMLYVFIHVCLFIYNILGSSSHIWYDWILWLNFSFKYIFKQKHWKSRMASMFKNVKKSMYFLENSLLYFLFFVDFTHLSSGIYVYIYILLCVYECCIHYYKFVYSFHKHIFIF